MNEPIRVLQAVTIMNRAGLETMLMNYYRHMDRRAVQFDFLTHRPQEGQFDEEIRDLGGRVYRVPPIAPQSLLQNRRETARFFRAHPEYRLVHAHMDALSGLPLSAAKAAGVSVRIAHSHVTAFVRDGKYPLRLLAKPFIPRYATAYMACSRMAGDFLFGRHFGGFILPNAIDAEAFRFDPAAREALRCELGLPEDAFALGHVGRFCPEKNHAFLLDVFAAILAREPMARLLLVGDGALREQIVERISALRLTDRVLLTGVRSDIPALMQAMDAFLLPSLFEGLGVVAVEAQAAGLPTFVSDAVPPEAGVTSLFSPLPLCAGAEHWANAVLAGRSAARPNTAAQVAAAGYDIRTEAQRLQTYYLDAWEGTL